MNANKTKVKAYSKLSTYQSVLLVLMDQVDLVDQSIL